MTFISKHAIQILLTLLLAVILFHIFIILKIIPYHIAWGGRLTNDKEMYVFETLSIFINLFLVMILIMKADFIEFKFSEKILTLILWAFFAIFILNTIGNFFAKTTFENSFSILTGLFAFLLWNIIMKKKTTHP